MNTTDRGRGISYGVMNLHFAARDRDFYRASHDNLLQSREILVKGFGACARKKNIAQSRGRNFNHQANDATERDARSQRSLRGMTDAAITGWLRRMLERTDLDLLSGQNQADLYGLNGYDDSNFSSRQFYTSAANACFIRAYVGISESSMLNLLLLGNFPSFFLRDPYEESAILNYLSVVGEETCAYAALGEGIVGNIPTHSGIYIVCT